MQHEVAGEGETGKLFRADFHDRHGRTVLILKPGLQVTDVIFVLQLLLLLPSRIEKLLVMHISVVHVTEYNIHRQPDKTSCLSDRECYP